MNLNIKYLFALLSLFVLVACVKNKPFEEAYQVPATFVPTTRDSSAVARIIMAEGVRNYLTTSTNVQLSQAILDSLWQNKDSTFTSSMISNFVYTSDILNRMRLVNLKNVTNDADSLKMIADSVVALSKKNGQTAANGIAGVQNQSSPVAAKRLFNEAGIELAEVWYNTMLGAMAMSNAYANFSIASQKENSPWDFAYQYLGFPQNYDPEFNYNAAPIKADRPLAITALFAEKNNVSLGKKIYEEYRRAKASAEGNNPMVAQSSIDSIKIYTEKLLANTALSALDSARQIADPVAKLHYLSRAYGIMRALKFRDTPALNATEYWQIRKSFNVSFYTLIQEPGYTTIEQIRNKLAVASSL